MNYIVSNKQAIQLNCINSNGLGEVTINLTSNQPNFNVKKTAYISGVYSLNGSNNLNPPKCNLDSYNSFFLKGNKSKLKWNTHQRFYPYRDGELTITVGKREVTINANKIYKEI